MITDKEAQLLLDAASSGIDSPEELANFMAQVTHESNGLRSLNEVFRYTKGISQISDKVRSALRQGPEALETARVEALNGKPEKLAELMYGGRMGNDLSGDAFKYHGRGYIQLTGKDQYEEAGIALGVDLLKAPELAAKPEYAGKIAIWYWNKNLHGKPAAEDVKQATHAINGGENGLDDRIKRFNEWKQVLVPTVVEELAKGKLEIPVQPSDQLQRHQATAAPSIQKLQEELNAFGYTDLHGRALATDGHYGKRTREAVEAFQRDQNLAVDGIAGPHTLAALRETARTPDIGTTALDAISEQLNTPPAYPNDTHQQLAFLQAQLREMQRQMEAMDRQRTAERERDDVRTASNEPAQHAPHYASTSHTAERFAYSDPRHPVHPLYADVKQRLEAQGHALPEDRLTQITGELHIRHFQPNWEGYIKVQNDKVLAGDYHPWGGLLTLDLKEPAPAAQETLQQVDSHQQALMQEQALRAQQTQSLGQGHALSR